MGGGTGQSFGGPAGGTTRGGVGAAGLSSSNFLSGSYVYPYVTANYTNDSTTGVTSGNAQVGKSGSSTTTKTASSYFTTSRFGSPLFTLTQALSGGRATVGGGGGGMTVGNGGYLGYVGAPSAPRMPHYAASIRFNANTISDDQLRGQLNEMLDRSIDSVPSRQRITLQVQGRDVVIKGQVADDDERRLVESMVRLTPGVGIIRNELQVK